MQALLLGLSLKRSKMHLQFKNMNDLNSFFKGLGLENDIEQQPTGRQLLNEFIPDVTREKEDELIIEVD